MEKNQKKEYIYVCACVCVLTHFSIYSKLTQSCKSIVLQLKKKVIFKTFCLETERQPDARRKFCPPIDKWTFESYFLIIPEFDVLR